MKDYNNLVKKITPHEKVLKNAFLAFFMGGFMGIVGEFLIRFYSYFFLVSSKSASTMMIVTIIFISCLLTSLGFFDKLVSIFKCGLIIPITGFAHATQSCALEYKKEGFLMGIGANMLKLSGSVIIYAIISAFVCNVLKVIIGGIL